MPDIKGKLYLIPSPIGQEAGSLNSYWNDYHQSLMMKLKYFIVETPKVAHNFLNKFFPEKIRQRITLYDLRDLDVYHITADEYLEACLRGHSVGLLADAGCPTVADPGAACVRAAHRLGIEVCPLVGPCSILLAFMGSGINTQQFSFNGYLPIDKREKIKAIKLYEKKAATLGQTQIFIETPYRNQQLFNDFLSNLKPSTQLCLATSLTTSCQTIKTKLVSEWQREKIKLKKMPTVFIVG